MVLLSLRSLAGLRRACEWRGTRGRCDRASEAFESRLDRCRPAQKRRARQMLHVAPENTCELHDGVARSFDELLSAADALARPQLALYSEALLSQEPASLDFTYVDDYSRHLLHYVASGISGRHRSLAQLYVNEDVTCRSGHGAQRAALLRHLLASGQLKGIDLNLTDAGCGSMRSIYWLNTCLAACRAACPSR